MRFVLVGKTGVGKSSTGNTILGVQKFVSSVGLSSETSKCEIHREVVLGENVEVVDTPGLYDTSVKEDEIAQVIVQAMACMYPGAHAFLFLVKIGARFTPEEAGTYKRIIAIFDESVSKHMIVVFTGGDELGPGTTISDIIAKAPPDLQNILKACENRYVVFNNKSTDKRQVKCLLDVARDVMRNNGNQCYKCPKYFSVNDTMQKEIQKRMAIVEKMESESNRHYKQLQEKIKKLKEKEKAMFEKREQEREKQLQQYETDLKEKICELNNKLQENNKERDDEMAKLMQEKRALVVEMEKKRNEDLKAMQERQQEMKEEIRDAKERMMWEVMNKTREKIAENKENGVVATIVDGLSGGIKKLWNNICSHVPSLPVFPENTSAPVPAEAIPEFWCQ